MNLEKMKFRKELLRDSSSENAGPPLQKGCVDKSANFGYAFYSRADFQLLRCKAELVFSPVPRLPAYVNSPPRILRCSCESGLGQPAREKRFLDENKEEKL